MHRKISATLVAISMSLVPVAVDAGEMLYGNDIHDRIVGKLFAYEGFEQGQLKQGRIRYSSNNRLLIRTAGGYKDGGSWRTINNQMCTRVEIGRSGGKVCFRIYDEGAGRYSTDHGYTLFPVAD